MFPSQIIPCFRLLPRITPKASITCLIYWQRKVRQFEYLPVTYVSSALEGSALHTPNVSDDWQKKEVLIQITLGASEWCVNFCEAFSLDTSSLIKSDISSTSKLLFLYIYIYSKYFANSNWFIISPVAYAGFSAREMFYHIGDFRNVIKFHA